jgi:phosphoribosyl-AMP cyclohydrolase
MKVKINGVDEVLTLVYSNRNSFQYNTAGNKSAHTFSQRIDKLLKGTKFRTSGNNYEIL